MHEFISGISEIPTILLLWTFKCLYTWTKSMPIICINLIMNLIGKHNGCFYINFIPHFLQNWTFFRITVKEIIHTIIDSAETRWCNWNSKFDYELTSEKCRKNSWFSHVKQDEICVIEVDNGCKGPQIDLWTAACTTIQY